MQEKDLKKKMKQRLKTKNANTMTGTVRAFLRPRFHIHICVVSVDKLSTYNKQMTESATTFYLIDHCPPL